MKVASLFVLLLACGTTFAGELSVDAAYRLIPHNRTLFDVHASKLSSTQAQALKQLFELSDRGVVLRVSGLNALTSRADAELQSVLSNYHVLSEAMASLAVPVEIKAARELVAQSLELHRRYFETKRREQIAAGEVELALRQNADVLAASQKLQRAYGVLMNAFPGEPAVNKQAFYDYLCALDFL